MFYINCTQGGKRKRKEERKREGRRTGRPAAGHNAGAPQAHRKNSQQIELNPIRLVLGFLLQ